MHINFIFFCLFMMFFTTAVSCEYIDDRQRVPSELLEVSFDKGELSLSGWAFMRSYINYYGSTTHSFSLNIKGPTHKVLPLELDSVDLTSIMSYRGNKQCRDNQKRTQSCNHIYQNVGFKGSIPLQELQEGDYDLTLVIHHKDTEHRVEVPSYLTSMRSLSHYHEGLEYVVDSVFKQGGLTVYYHTLIATATPSPSYEGRVVEYGQTCSSADGNTAFYRKGATFHNIMDVSRYKDLVSYFKVRAKQSGCFDGRQRLVEGNEVTVHIPSTYVNYTGGRMKLKIRQKLPKLDAQPLKIKQYQTYDAFEKVTAFDHRQLNTSNRINISSNNVNERIPGVYQTCYVITDSWKRSARSCRKVILEKIPTYSRYMSENSFSRARLKLWNQIELKRVIQDAFLRRKRYIKKSY
ncbi:DUF5011 domain-containing protein [Erysipelothrix piscisicarius]|nr:DUF5011 domain-containing protein [Erysipelothrix piscisicarius]